MNFDTFILQECPALANQENDTKQSEGDNFKVVGETIDEIDLLGRPWEKFNESLSPDDRQQLRDSESAVDRAVIDNNHKVVLKVLAVYKSQVLDLRRRKLE